MVGGMKCGFILRSVSSRRSGIFEDMGITKDVGLEFGRFYGLVFSNGRIY